MKLTHHKLNDRDPAGAEGYRYITTTSRGSFLMERETA